MNKFTPTANRTSIISNEVLEKHRYDLSLNAQKLLYGIAQSIDHTIDMFPKIEVDIHGLFEYLQIQDRKDKYRVVYDAFAEIGKNPLMTYESDKEWSVIPWASISFDENKSKYVSLQFTEDIKPYLLSLSGYVKVKGRYICSLSSRYATWLYPVMKMILEKYYGKHEISIQRLKELTFTDDPKKNPGYNHEVYGDRDFIKRCLGIKKDRKTKQWTIAEDSPLYEISEKTDIVITAEVLKSGRKADRVRFYVQSKSTSSKPTFSGDKSQYVSEIPKKLTSPVRFPLTEVFKTAKEAGMTVQDFCDTAGYYITGNWVYKKYTEPKQGKRRTGGKMQISNAVGQLSLLDQTGDND